MGLGGVIDIAIGLTFTYLLLSLICSGLNELLAWLAGLRPATLYSGVEMLLQDDELAHLAARVYRHPLVAELHNDPLFKLLRSRAGYPSYIPPGRFARALLDELSAEVGVGSSVLLDKLVATSEGAGKPAALEVVIQSLKGQMVAIDRAIVDVRSAAKDAKLSLPDLTAPLSSAVVDLARQIAGKKLGSRLEALQAELDKYAPFPGKLRAALQSLPESADQKEVLALLSGGSLASVDRVLAALPAGSQVRRALTALLDETVKDFGVYCGRVEMWFDESMDRVSGWYRRRSQIINLVVAGVISVGFCVDSLVIAQTLMKSSDLRTVVASAGRDAAKELAPMFVPPAGDGDTHPAPSPGAVPSPALALHAMSNALSRLDDLPLPMGFPAVRRLGPAQGYPARERWNSEWWLFWFERLLGMLVTWVAISLGAPFWFDALNRVVNMRSSGPPPPKPSSS